jgi:XTP/dITP diphosphohydrolase
MTKLLLASRNPGKIHELRSLLAGIGLELVDLQSLGLYLDVEERGDTYFENAAHKAMVFAELSKCWALADDSGLEVEALDGAPGIRSARLAGPGKSDQERRNYLLELLEGHAEPWTARFQCSVVLANPAGGIDTAHGTCEGRVIAQERGEHGFGYDPIFHLAEIDKTMAELTIDEKNRLSHRARAVEAIIPIIKEKLGVE